MAYEIPLTKDFKPQIFYDISDVINEKVELLNLFKSQMDKLYLKANAIKGLAEYRALQSRLNRKSNQPDASYVGTFEYVEAFDHVEAFEVLKICVDKGFKLWNASPEKFGGNEYTIPKYVEMLEIVR